MAFAAVGSLGSTSEKPGSPDESIVLTVSATGNVGNVAVVAVCMDNVGTSEAETTQLSVADSAGNTWIPVGGGSEYTLSSGAANDGIVTAVFATKITSQIDSGSDTITVSTSSNVTAKAMAAYEFSMGSGTLAFADAFFQATLAGTDPEAVSVSGLTSREYLLIHAIGEERGSTHTADGDYTEVFDAVETTGGAAASNVSLFMAYRIATLTSDTVDAASSVDGDTAQVVAAFYESTTTAYELNVEPGSYTVAGAAAGLLEAAALNAAAGSYAVTGFVAGTVRGRVVNAASGSYTVSGLDAGLVEGATLNLAPGSYAVTGFAAGLVEGAALNLEPGTYAVTGFEADLVFTPTAGAFEINAAAGSYAVAGADAGVVEAAILNLAPGSYAATGAAATFDRTRVLGAAAGSYTLTGFQSDLVGPAGAALPAITSRNRGRAGLSATRGRASAVTAGRIGATNE